MSDHSCRRRRFLQTGSIVLTGSTLLTRSATAETTSELLLDEDFEEYDSGEVPSSFSTGGNSDQFIVDTVAYAGEQAYLMSGDRGGCWEALVRIPMGYSPQMSIRGYYQLADGAEGCHSEAGEVNLRTETGGGTYPGEAVNVLSFYPDGTVETTGGEVVGQYTENEWVRFEVEYLRDTDSGKVTYTCQINDQDVVSVTRPSKSYEDDISALDLHSGDFTVYWDEVKIKASRESSETNIEAPPETDNGAVTETSTEAPPKADNGAVTETGTEVPPETDNGAVIETSTDAPPETIEPGIGSIEASEIAAVGGGGVLVTLLGYMLNSRDDETDSGDDRPPEGGPPPDDDPPSTAASSIEDPSTAESRASASMSAAEGPTGGTDDFADESRRASDERTARPPNSNPEDSLDTEYTGGAPGEHDTKEEIPSDSELGRLLETPVEDADEEFVGRLIDALGSRDATERTVATEKIGEIASERPALVEPAVDELRDLRLDPNRKVSRTASDVLNRLPDDLRS